ncbi:MAG TPA: HU family DNA-binding protein [Clostridiales bacterium]|nr:HU family DNA-binding protein [Clostridiales bacterium]
MNKTEFIAEVASKAELSKKQAEAAYEAMLETVVEALKGGEKVQLVGFGSFELKEKPAREVFNPLTKQKQKLAACKVPAFKMGKSFKAQF